VENFGPLWAHGAFIFEHMGGRALHSTYGKRTAIQSSIAKHFLRLNNQHALLLRLAMTEESCIRTAHHSLHKNINIHLSHPAYAQLLARLGGAGYFEHPEKFGAMNNIIREQPEYVYGCGKGVSCLIEDTLLDKVNITLRGKPVILQEKCKQVTPILCGNTHSPVILVSKSPGRCLQVLQQELQTEVRGNQRNEKIKLDCNILDGGRK
jgi:hypothetical protein